MESMAMFTQSDKGPDSIQIRRGLESLGVTQTSFATFPEEVPVG